MTRTPRVAIALPTILVTIAIVVLLGISEHLAAFLEIVVLAFILASAMVPAVTYFVQRGRPRLAAVGSVFGLLILAVLVVSIVAVPVFLEQTHHLATHLPEYTAKLKGTQAWLQALTDRYPMLPSLDTLADTLSKNASDYLKGSLGIAGKLIGATVEGVVVFVTAFFLLLEGPHLEHSALSLLPPRHRDLMHAQVGPIILKLGGYVQGMAISILALTVYTALVLMICHVPLALVLAFIAGICAIIPMIGGYIGLIPITLVALTVSWQLAVGVVIACYIGVWLVGHVLMPVVFSKSVHLSPLMVMLAMLLGVETMGIFGALTAVPLLATVQVLIKNLYIEPMDIQHSQMDGRVKCATPLRYHVKLEDA